MFFAAVAAIALKSLVGLDLKVLQLMLQSAAIPGNAMIRATLRVLQSSK
jgi:hypothetical protein